MPRRNLLIICLAFAVSLLCYNRADRNRYVRTLAEAMQLVDERYVEEVRHRQVFENAMNGIVEGLDPYSAYIPPKQYRRLLEDLVQQFGGIGIVVELSPDTKRLTVLSRLPNTPAYRAGIRAGDTIVAIDGQDTLGLSLKDCVELIQGPVGKSVRLNVLHAGEEEPVEVTLERATIPIESVLGDTRREDGTWDFSLPDHPRITYVRVVNFGERTERELAQVLKSQQVEALVLDLRDNAGGLFPAAVDVCRQLVPTGEIVSTRGRGGRVARAYFADGRTLVDPQVPIAVLVNRFSASASEVVAACLQDHGRAKIIGQRTWGKGTVQNILDLEGGQSALKLTTYYYWRPSGKNIHRRKGDKDDAPWGVQPDPDGTVELTDAEAARVRQQRRLRDAGREPEKPEGDAKPEAKTKPEDTAKPNAPSEGRSQDTPPETPNDQPFEDPQVRTAIEYLESVLARGQGGQTP
jgi:carboxyl-terminal processing protease